MKKRNLFYALTAGIALFSACNNNSDEFTPSDDNAAQQLVLQVASSGDGLTTRAGRPLYSSEAKQTIENVKVLICEKTGGRIVYDTLITQWSTPNVSEEYHTGGHGREKKILLDGNNKLEKNTKYIVYAIGYSDGSKYQKDTKGIAEHLATYGNGLEEDGKTPDNTETVKTFEGNLQLTLSQEGTTLADKIGEEIFAGSKEVTMNDGALKHTITLARQVAGTFGYFKEVPYIDGAAKLRLVAYNRNQDLVLGQFNTNVMTENGTENNAAMFVVNGTTPVNDKVIYEINLADWYTNITDTDRDGLIDITNWKNPYDGKAKFKNGSAFGGNFVIPFAKDAAIDSPKNTFELQLTDNGGKVLRTWIVKLPGTDKQVKEQHSVWSWNV